MDCTIFLVQLLKRGIISSLVWLRLLYLPPRPLLSLVWWLGGLFSSRKSQIHALCMYARAAFTQDTVVLKRSLRTRWIKLHLVPWELGDTCVNKCGSRINITHIIVYICLQHRVCLTLTVPIRLSYISLFFLNQSRRGEYSNWIIDVGWFLRAGAPYDEPTNWPLLSGYWKVGLHDSGIQNSLKGIYCFGAHFLLQ